MRALVLSPFAPIPLDAGHRRRVSDSLLTLGRLGYRIDFLHVCFEFPWCQQISEDLEVELRPIVAGYYHIAASPIIGQKPANGRRHELDEWWNDDLGLMISRLVAQKTYDVFVVHNVWLSKAFEYVPIRIVKVLETHDLFWARAAFYEENGLEPDFFLPEKQQELIGLSRADVVITIQEEEAVALIRESVSTVVNVPYGTQLASSLRQRFRDYLHPDKVVFGVLGSAHPFNVLGLRELIRATEREIGETSAPVDVVVAGRMGESLHSRMPVHHLGYVENSADFYNVVDYVVAPVFSGSGLKVKVVDSLSEGLPVLCAAHAARGIPVPSDWVCNSAGELARLMSEIAINRPSYDAALTRAANSATAIARKCELGEAALERRIGSVKRVIEFDCCGASWAHSLLLFTAYYSLAREIADSRFVVFRMDQRLTNLVGRGLRVGMRAVSVEQATAPLDYGDHGAITITWRARGDTLSCRSGSRVFDSRMAKFANDQPSEEGNQHGGLYAPIVGSPFFWDPVVPDIRRAVWDLLVPHRKLKGVVLVDAPLDGRDYVMMENGALVLSIRLASQRTIALLALIHLCDQTTQVYCGDLDQGSEVGWHVMDAIRAHGCPVDQPRDEIAYSTIWNIWDTRSMVDRVTSAIVRKISELGAMGASGEELELI